MQPSVIISQDLSGVGQVSLGVALPLLAAMDFNPYVLPTAYLSAHTGFAGNTYTDLSAQMPATLAHWASLDLHPQGLLLGYLGAKALTVWQQALPNFAAVPVRVVDPVMGDHGRLYSGFDDDYVTAMRQLLTRATVITPNPTEAQLLLGDAPSAAPLTQAAAQRLVARLVARFDVAVVLTGVALGDKIAVLGQTPGHGGFVWTGEKLAGQYFGTGDIFSAVVCGALMHGLPLAEACKLAAQFVSRGIQRTIAQNGDARFGVDYMASLPWLLAKFRG